MKQEKNIAPRIPTLIERCRLILDPSRIRFINMRLGDAIRTHPDLEGIADVVIDNMGAVQYAGSEHTSYFGVKAMERWLLKKKGTHFPHKTSFLLNTLF